MGTVKNLAILAMLTATACGGSMGGSSEAASALAAYQALGRQMSTEIATYAAQATTLPDAAACEAAHARYEAAMPGMVERMRQMSVAMDQHMAGMGRGDFDMTCTADAMAAELERHHGAACTGAEVTADEQEVAEHVANMGNFMQQQRMRYQNAGASMGMMNPPYGTIFACHENADGSFTFGDETWTPGTPVPGSGTCTGYACVGEPWPTPCGGMMCGGMGM